MPPRVEQSRSSNAYLQGNPKKDFTASARAGSSRTTPNKEPADGSSTLTQNSIDSFGEETPPPPVSDTSTPITDSCAKEKESASGTREEHRYVFLPGSMSFSIYISNGQICWIAAYDYQRTSQVI